MECATMAELWIPAALNYGKGEYPPLKVGYISAGTSAARWQCSQIRLTIASDMAVSNVNTTTAVTVPKEDICSGRVATELPATRASEVKEIRQMATAQAVMEESGDDLSSTITLVTPRKDYVCPAQSNFLTPVQETSMYASAELVCSMATLYKQLEL